MLATTADAQRQIMGERALLQRRRRGLGQRELSKLLGWGPNRVGYIERGTVALDVTELYDLADALECTVEYLLAITNDPKAHMAWRGRKTDDLQGQRARDILAMAV